MIGRHQLPHLILVQPNRVRISGDEFIDGLPFDLLRARNSSLLAIGEDRHVVLFPLTSGALLRFGQLAFPFCHELSFLLGK